jgi:DNA-binding NarL/FixJ family response regulator
MALRTVIIPAPGAAWFGLRRSLAALPGITVVGEVERAADALALIREVKPDVVVSALLVEGRSALPLLTAVRGALPRARLILIGARFPRAEVAALATLLIDGCWTWDDLQHPSFPGLHDAVLNGPFVAYNRGMVRAAMEALSPSRRPAEIEPGLSARERIVLDRLAEGLTREQIAMAESLTPRTVDRVITSLKSKLEAPSLFVLGVRAARLGLSPRA